MGYLDLSRQTQQKINTTYCVNRMHHPHHPHVEKPPRRSVSNAQLLAETNTVTGEISEISEISTSRVPRRGRTESQLWWRLLGLARALGGASGQEARADLSKAWRQDARLVAMEGQLHIITGMAGEVDPIERQTPIRLVLDALMRDEGVMRLLLMGDMPPASAVCKPLTPCWSCRSRSWWQRPDGGWVCGVCHPAK